MTLTTDHKEELYERLKDRKYAAGYLSACASEGKEALLVGLRDVAEALGDVRQVAEETGLNRENMYRILSESGNPRLESFLLVLDWAGMDMSFSPKQA